MGKNIRKSFWIFTVIVLLASLYLFAGCKLNQGTSEVNNSSGQASENYKVTFIELGSVGCIPCARMRSVMKSIEEKYGSQVKIVFYDVWTEAGAPYGKKYGITSIPTQVFLDRKGKEYFRHEGFFPEEELVKVLEKKGVR